MKLTVFYDDGFWVGVIEDQQGDRIRASRYIFGAEPHDAEVMEFILQRMMPLIESTTQSVSAKSVLQKRMNPKRLARQSAQEMQRHGVCTQAQKAIQVELEHRKVERRTYSKAEREAEQQHKRNIAIAKAKAKHRGR